MTSRKFQLFRIQQIGLLTDRTDRGWQEIRTPFLANQKAIRLDSSAGLFPEQRLLIKSKGENEKAEAKSKQLTYYKSNNDKYINVVIL